jgi:uncharacterized protein (TIGR02588 family)
VPRRNSAAAIDPMRIRARNLSAASVAQVEIEGVLKQDDKVIEAAHTTFDYVPGKSIRRGGLFFTQDPRVFEIKLRALGYAEP